LLRGEAADACGCNRNVVVDVVLPYCGTPPSPGELLTRFNLDPVLLVILAALAVAHLINARTSQQRLYAACGWIVAAVAFISPLCALSVALFSARIAQHMILLLIAAPLMALALPSSGARGGLRLWASGLAFFVALWVWHMPVPYDATFASSAVYWAMHVTLFGSGILLWRELLHHPSHRTADALVVGLLTSMQMGLLGAVLALATHPLFFPHLLTTAAWKLTALQDQQLGGTLMWVPGIALFLWAAIRSVRRLWRALEPTSQRGTSGVS
jgi:putative membrane protein